MAAKTNAKGKHPNILLLAVDSLRAWAMSCYGYPQSTTPHLDRLAAQGTLFERNFSPHIPTTPAYATLLTGRDCFGHGIVALRHQGPMASTPTLPEILGEAGYNTSCVGFKHFPSARGFQNYFEYSGWGSWNEGRSHKAENLNQVAIPEIDRLCDAGKPWFVMLRHMDPHSPYLPPAPFDRIFYHGNECDPKNKSLEAVYKFKPFADYFRQWFPPGCTDARYVNAQYHGAIAYMDACIQVILEQLASKGVLENTIVVLNADHGETLDEHECWFDHHGMYDNVLHVPLIIRYPSKVPAGLRVKGFSTHMDLAPTLLELAGVKSKARFEGRSLLPMIAGDESSHACEFYITECTWQRKHGWRTPQWKLHLALEPDFHFKPPVELYNMVEDPLELRNVADKHPDVVAHLKARMEAFIARREKETGITNPMLTQGDWHGYKGIGPFKTSQQAYDTLHIGDPKQAAKLQKDTGETKKK